MSNDVECKKRISYAWTVERPLMNRPRRSPMFIYIDNHPFYLNLVVTVLNDGCMEMHQYELSIGPDNQSRIADMVNIVHVEDGRGKALPLSYSRKDEVYKNFKGNDVCNCCQSSRPCTCSIIWTYSEVEILKVFPNFHPCSLLTFVINFNNEHEQVKLTPPPALAPTFEACKIAQEKSVQTSSYMNDIPCLESLSEDLSKLLDQAPDVVRICENLKFNAQGHNVLCIPSEVLAEMLSSEMVKGGTNIQDMDQETLSHFVRYLYLKEKATEYILQKKVHLQPDWLEFCKRQPLLAIEILNRFCRGPLGSGAVHQVKRPRID